MITRQQHSMYTNVPNLIIGFHGCDKTVAEDIIMGKTEMKMSRNKYDWLGNGIYFWEQNLQRAWQWAEDSKSVKTPAALGAVIDLGYCLNLLDSKCIELLKDSYADLSEISISMGKSLPQNRNLGTNTDLLLRNLDCAVIENLHSIREERVYRPFDSVRGLFTEGGEVYDGSGFREKTHIQICVRNPNCIKGFFLPRDVDLDWDIP